MVLVSNEEIQGFGLKNFHLGGGVPPKCEIPENSPKYEIPKKPNCTRKISKLMMDTIMGWSSQENLHCLAALEAPSHSLELVGWGPPQAGGIL